MRWTLLGLVAVLVLTVGGGGWGWLMPRRPLPMPGTAADSAREITTRLGPYSDDHWDLGDESFSRRGAGALLNWCDGQLERRVNPPRVPAFDGWLAVSPVSERLRVRVWLTGSATARRLVDAFHRASAGCPRYTELDSGGEDGAETTATASRTWHGWRRADVETKGREGRDGIGWWRLAPRAEGHIVAARGGLLVEVVWEIGREGEYGILGVMPWWPAQGEAAVQSVLVALGGTRDAPGG